MTKSDKKVLGVVQFLHPGKEHRVNVYGWTPWNVGPHRRKFMITSGSAVHPDSQMKNSGLSFWGEWEGPSRNVYTWADRTDELPANLVVPVFPGKPHPISGLQNTDPYIFGRTFSYTLCKQVKRSGQATLLTRLLPGSLILFGSRVASRFVLDTVFVVSEHIVHHSSADWGTKLSSTSDAYKAMTLHPMYWDENTSKDAVYTHYEGATFQNPSNQMFSFVPAIVETAEPRRFARPVFENDSVISQDLNMNYRFTEMVPGQIFQIWQSVRQQVLDQGLVLGVQFAEPLFEAVSDQAWPK